MNIVVQPHVFDHQKDQTQLLNVCSSVSPFIGSWCYIMIYSKCDIHMQDRFYIYILIFLAWASFKSFFIYSFVTTMLNCHCSPCYIDQHVIQKAGDGHR